MGQRTLFRAALALVFSLAAAAHSEIYQWTDAQGHAHFGDHKPLQGPAKVITPTINTYSSPTVSPIDWKPPETATAPRGVVMYSASWCGVCKRARAYFQQHGVAFREYDVEKDERGREDFQAMHGRGVPIILVGSYRMNGFSAKQFEQLYRTTAQQ